MKISTLQLVVESVLDRESQIVKEYLDGKKAFIGVLMGNVMKETQGSADPAEAMSLIQSELDKIKI